MSCTERDRINQAQVCLSFERFWETQDIVVSNKVIFLIMH